MMAANAANPKGYFEPQDIADIHDELLASAGSVWHDWRPFPEAWFGSTEAIMYRARLAEAFRANYGEMALPVLKEPRMCRILPLWRDVFGELRVRPLFCFIDRPPLEVAKSLLSRDGSSIDQGLRYYISNHLEAEHATRGERRVFVSYEMLLVDWRRLLDGLRTQLGVDLACTAEQGRLIDAFLEKGLRHESAGMAADPEDALHALAITVHEAFNAMSMGQSGNRITACLDAARAAFRALGDDS
jgi:hypothetical protein